MHGGDNRNSSSVFDPISLASGDGSGGDGDFVHYCTELIMVLRLNVLSVGGGLSDCVPVI